MDLANTEIHADIVTCTIRVIIGNISGNNRDIVELTGTAQEVFEGARLVMSMLTRNTFSMGAVITVENVVIQGNVHGHNRVNSNAGWIWNITEQWRYTLFVPDPKHPLAKQFNIGNVFQPICVTNI